MGSEDHDPHVLYLIDFGLARLFVDPETGQHIPSRDGLSRIGTARYSSYNTHFGRGEYFPVPRNINAVEYLTSTHVQSKVDATISKLSESVYSP